MTKHQKQDAASESPPGHKEPHHATFLERIRRHFLAGLLVLVPIVIAVWAIIFLFSLADKFIGEYLYHALKEYVQVLLHLQDDDKSLPMLTLRGGFSVLTFFMALFFIVAVGYLSTFFLIRKLIHFGESIVTRIPLVKFFYTTPKEVLSTFAASQNQASKRVVMIEYPRHGIWCLGFATGEFTLKPNGTEMISIFVPTTPNPTSGFFLMVPRTDVYDTELNMEEGVRLIISGGILSPDSIGIRPFTHIDATPAIEHKKLLPSTIAPSPSEDDL